MSDYRSCENCDLDCKEHANYCTLHARFLWIPIPCPYCGEAMSEIREHNGKQYRHCYGCHFEFAEGGE